MDRAAWDSESTQTLLEVCINQINAGEQEVKGRGNVKKYSKKGWDYILATFNNETSKQYKKSHLKNRLDVLRRVYKDWSRLLNEPGAGEEAAESYKVVQPNEWWEHNIVKDNAYRKFRNDGLIHGEAMRKVFEGMEETLENVKESPPTYIYSPNIKRPQKQKEGLDLPSEGSGDSEDEMFGFNKGPLNSTGVTDEMRGLGCRSCTGITGSGSKRKTCGEGSVQKSGKKKVPTEKNIADAYSAMERPSFLIEHRHVTADVSNEHLEALHALYGLEKFNKNEDFRRSCMLLLGDPESRKMLSAFSKMGKDEYLLEWLDMKIE